MYTVCINQLHVYCCQDVDQATGRDLNLGVNRLLVGGEVRDEGAARNPDRWVCELSRCCNVVCECVHMYTSCVVHSVCIWVMMCASV